MIWLILFAFLALSYLRKPKTTEPFLSREYNGLNIATTPTGTDIVTIDCNGPDLCPVGCADEKVCPETSDGNCAYTVPRPTYHPRYKFWWRWIRNLKTRPEYDRIFPPFWNTWYDPNVTSDIYYQKVAADNILIEGKDNCKVRQAQKDNFDFRQSIKFANRPGINHC